jgi:hypothetical protein
MSPTRRRQPSHRPGSPPSRRNRWPHHGPLAAARGLQAPAASAAHRPLAQMPRLTCRSATSAAKASVARACLSGRGPGGRWPTTRCWRAAARFGATESSPPADGVHEHQPPTGTRTDAPPALCRYRSSPTHAPAGPAGDRPIPRLRPPCRGLLVVEVPARQAPHSTGAGDNVPQAEPATATSPSAPQRDPRSEQPSLSCRRPPLALATWLNALRPYGATSEAAAPTAQFTDAAEGMATRRRGRTRPTQHRQRRCVGAEASRAAAGEVAPPGRPGSRARRLSRTRRSRCAISSQFALRSWSELRSTTCSSATPGPTARPTRKMPMTCSSGGTSWCGLAK